MSSRFLLEPLEDRCLLTTYNPAIELTSQQVFNIIKAAAAVALPSQTIVVVDRSGDVLGMYGQDPANPANGFGGSGPANGNDNNVDGSVNPDDVLSDDTTPNPSNGNPAIVNALTPNTAAKYAVIQATARARTAAYFESTDDAFTTRTARFIVQPNFPPGVDNTEAGPLLGVEFSNALGTDALPPGLTSGLAAGLSGDPGGIPLFINGQPVGAIGVAGDGSDVAALASLVATPSPNNMPAYYSNQKGKSYNGNEESDFDEAVALAGAKNFMAPGSIQAGQIFVNGIRLPFTGEGAASKAPAATALVLTNSGLVKANVADLPVPVFFNYMPLIGNATYLSSVPAATPNPIANTISGGKNVTTFQSGKNTIAGVNPTSIYTTSTTIKMSNGKLITVTLNNNNPLAGGFGADANGSGGFISQVNGGGMVPTVASNGSVTWAAGNFGFLAGQTTDSSLAADQLTVQQELQIIEQAVSESQSIRGAIREPADVPAEVYVAITDTEGNILAVASTYDATNFSFDVAVQKARTAAFFSSDEYAFSSRAVGFVADTTLPPAIDNGVEGPLNGLQDTLALPGYQGMFSSVASNGNPLANGITIFPGGAPLYKPGTDILIGAIGVSGDGVDQDDLIAAAGATGFAAPAKIQDDALSSSQIVGDITTSIDKLQSILGGVNPFNGQSGGSLPTINQLILLGIDDPDSPNRDKITLDPATENIINRILERLSAKGVDKVNLPYQKFPRNPGL